MVWVETLTMETSRIAMNWPARITASRAPVRVRAGGVSTVVIPVTVRQIRYG